MLKHFWDFHGMLRMFIFSRKETDIQPLTNQNITKYGLDFREKNKDA